MAEKKAKDGKGYSTGNKKWLIAFGVLVLIAVIVVVILLVIPANTYSMVETLQTASTSTFLINDTEKNNYNDFKSKISGNSLINYYSQEMNDTIILTESLTDVVIYYNQFMVFAEDNDVLKENYKVVKDNLEEAFNDQKEMDNILSEVSKLADTSASYLQNAMVDFRTNYYHWLDNYKDAISGLSKCYQGCFKGSITNNKASTIILNTVNDFINVITNDFKLLVSSDVKADISSSNYNYSSHGKILYFESFVDAYLNNNYEINNYLFKADLQDKYQKISDFFTLYNETNFYEIINSISNSSNYPITKTYDVEDGEGLYDGVKEFLNQRG